VDYSDNLDMSDDDKKLVEECDSDLEVDILEVEEVEM
jgi:hypothetical protein